MAMKVFLIAKTHCCPGIQDFYRYKNLGEFNPQTTNSHGEAIVELAGRICYDSYQRPRPGGNQAYLENIIKVGHGSVTEHATWTIAIVGVSRDLTHELVRHRTMSFSQRSQRYCDETRMSYVSPSNLTHELNKRVSDHNSSGRMLYMDLLDHYANSGISGKTARGNARKVLMSSHTTEIVVTFNTRSVRNFLELRCSSAADKEIRELANLVFDLLLSDSPNLFQDYEKVPLEDGTFELTTPFRKI
jgi:thymidylate synthase (FAD)